MFLKEVRNNAMLMRSIHRNRVSIPSKSKLDHSLPLDNIRNVPLEPAGSFATWPTYSSNLHLKSSVSNSPSREGCILPLKRLKARAALLKHRLLKRCGQLGTVRSVLAKCAERYPSLNCNLNPERGALPRPSPSMFIKRRKLISADIAGVCFKASRTLQKISE